MPRKAGETHQEQQVKKAKQNEALEIAKAKKNLMVVLKANGHLWVTLYKYTQLLGYDVDITRKRFYPLLLVN